MTQDLGQGPVTHHLHIAQDKGVGPCGTPLVQIQGNFSSTHACMCVYVCVSPSEVGKLWPRLPGSWLGS